MRDVKLLWCLILFLTVSDGQRSQVEEELSRRLACVEHEECGPCLATAAHAQCRWCSDPYYANTSVPRCNNEASLIDAGCAQYFIESPEQSEVEVVEDHALQDRMPGDTIAAVQIQPQKISIKMRPHETYTVNFTYRPARNYPLDLYYLMDLTWSMKDDKETLVYLRDDLPVMLNNLTDNFRLGFGSFADKPLMPYTVTSGPLLTNPCLGQDGSVCEPTYCFRHRLSLTGEVSEFIKQVNSSSVTGNLDNTEAGLDALMQALVCKDRIGWSDVSRKIIIFVSDGLLHFAGDGKLGGAVERNDEQCHLDDNGFYSAATRFDYPSLQQIHRLLDEKKVNIIFAVTEEVKRHYDNLHKILDANTYIGNLEANSSNILKLVKKGYEDIVSTVNFEDDATAPIKMVYYSDCGRVDGKMAKTRKCTGVEFGKSYNFEVHVAFDECLEYKKGQKQVITIKDTQLGQDSLTLEVELICGCNCEDKDKMFKGQCHENSEIVCGICQCLEDWSGPNCDCKATDHASSVALHAQCRESNVSRLCSGAGDCVCGKCICDPGRTGKYCECKPCPVNAENGLECGGVGRGNCNCATNACACAAGWSGDSCACSSKQDACVAPGDSQICSGHGDCVCEKCQCVLESGVRYAGEYCETCATCSNSVCGVCEACVSCSITNSCTTECSGRVDCDVTLAVTNSSSSIPSDSRQAWCVVRLEEEGQECEYGYTYRALDAKTVSTVVRTKQCAQFKGAMIMMSGLIIMAFTIAVGILVIAAVKSAQVIADQRAYAQFRKEAERSMLEMSNQNPLYISPITEYKLPESFPRDNAY